MEEGPKVFCGFFTQKKKMKKCCGRRPLKSTVLKKALKKEFMEEDI